MKQCFFIFCFLSSFSFSQSKFHFLDEKTKKEIYYVQVFNEENELIAISDINGEIILKSSLEVIIVKHLDYQTKKIFISDSSNIYLKARFQYLDEISVAPKNSKDLYDELIKKTSAKIPRENFNGILNYSSTYIRIRSDSIYKFPDTLVFETDFKVAFQYIFKKNKHEMKFDFLEGKQTIYSELKKNQIDTTMFEFYIYDLVYFFENDFIEIDNYERYSKRRKYKIKNFVDTISYLQISKNKEDDNFRLDVLYQQEDSCIINLKFSNQRIKNNAIYTDRFRFVNFDTLNNIFYPIYSDREYNARILSYKSDVSIQNLEFGTKEFINQGFKDMEEKVKNIHPTIKKYEVGMLPKVYYKLFKN